jgi:Bacterial SH3 domain
MASPPPSPGNIHLRYGSADVFEQADTRAKVVAKLAPQDPFAVLGTEDEFYRVQLPGGAVGFIYAHNVVGTDMPLTGSEQRTADERAAEAARPPRGWRGLLHRLRGAS